MFIAAPEGSTISGPRQHLSLGVQVLQERLQSPRSNLQSKTAGLMIAELPVQQQPLLHFFRAHGVNWRRDFSMNDRKVDPHLVQPIRMHWRMHQDCFAVSVTQQQHNRLAAMHAAVRYDSEDPVGRAVGFFSHVLLDQRAKRLDSGLSLGTAQDLPTSDIPGSQVLQSHVSLPVALDARWVVWRCRRWLVAGAPGLDAGFLIRVVPAAQRITLPEAGVPVKDSPGLVGELRVTRDDANLTAPGLDCVGVEDVPGSALANRQVVNCRGSSGQVGGRQPAHGNLVWQTALKAVALTTAWL